MNAWSHLPNAAHIDRVIQSIKSHPEVWSTARIAAWDAAEVAAWEAAWDAAEVAAWEAARLAVPDVGLRGVARRTARSAILALIAYDDSAKYLNMPSDQLKMWAILSEEPAAVLLLSAVVAYEKIGELELA